MSHRDKEPAGLTILKIISAVVLVLVALAFGAVGACGVWVSVNGIWDTIRQQTTAEAKGIWVVGAICAVFGGGIAWRLVRAAIAIFRKREDRHE